MTDITDPDLLDIFIGRQNIDNVRLNGGDIDFDVRTSDPNAETKSGSIRQSDIKDIAAFFSGTLQSRPFAKHLLQILWIREVKFAMNSLKDDDVYDFVQGAFTLYGVDIDEETVENELCELVYGGYLQENNAGFSLTSEGKHTAEKMFKAVNMLVDDGIAQLTSEIIACLKNNKPAKTKRPRKKRQSIYEHDVEVCLNELVDAAIGQGEDKKQLLENITAAKFAEYLKEHCAKFKNTDAKNIANALTNRSDAWKNRNTILARMYGKEPPPLSDVCDVWTDDDDTDDAGGGRTGTGLANALPTHGYNIVESSRMECEEAVEECFRKYLLDGKKPLLNDVAQWINENIPEFKNKDIERIKNGVKYSDAWRNREQFF